jgi:hypothetical protein
MKNPWRGVLFYLGLKVAAMLAIQALIRKYLRDMEKQGVHIPKMPGEDN